MELTLRNAFKLALTAAVLSACVQAEPITEYRPVVDPGRTNAAKFEKDLQACRAIAVRVEADYKKRQEEQMAANMMAGLLVGAIAGAAIGDSGDYIAAGAAYGAAAGAATNDYGYDLVKYGPRRIVDRCMSERGHVILNDIGRG
jgi:outer membrane lipoprotein SlyB